MAVEIKAKLQDVRWPEGVRLPIMLESGRNLSDLHQSLGARALRFYPRSAVGAELHAPCRRKNGEAGAVYR